jgi:hypothetical protein
MAKDLFKNMMCGSIGLLVIFVTSIFVIDDYFSERIQKAIDEATLLKEYNINNKAIVMLVGDSFQ